MSTITGYTNYVIYDSAGQILIIDSKDEAAYETFDPKSINPTYNKLRINFAIGDLLGKRRHGHYVEEITDPLAASLLNMIGTTISDDKPSRTFGVYAKKQVTITVSTKQFYTNNGQTQASDEISRITHDAPEPLMIWANSRPLDQMVDGAKGYSVHSTIASRFLLKVRHPRYFAERVEIEAVPRPSNPTPNPTTPSGANT